MAVFGWLDFGDAGALRVGLVAYFWRDGARLIAKDRAGAGVLLEITGPAVDPAIEVIRRYIDRHDPADTLVELSPTCWCNLAALGRIRRGADTFALYARDGRQRLLLFQGTAATEAARRYDIAMAMAEGAT